MRQLSQYEIDKLLQRMDELLELDVTKEEAIEIIKDDLINNIIIKQD
jgi:hypothetical protein